MLLHQLLNQKALTPGSLQKNLLMFYLPVWLEKPPNRIHREWLLKTEKNAREDTTNAISDDEMNTVADGKSSVSDLKDLVQEMKQELVEKPAAQDPAMAGDLAANAAVSASVPELLEKLEELLKRVTRMQIRVWPVEIGKQSNPGYATTLRCSKRIQARAG